jgi:hypothetical protein
MASGTTGPAGCLDTADRNGRAALLVGAAALAHGFDCGIRE